MTYNGWTNYETWLTNLYFDDFTSHFEEMIEEGQFDEMDDDEILDCCTDYIEQVVDDVVSYTVTTTDNFISDIISSFTQEVNYKEIAEHYVADIIADVAIRNKEAV
jgi:hypothetical protein